MPAPLPATTAGAPPPPPSSSSLALSLSPSAPAGQPAADLPPSTSHHHHATATSAAAGVSQSAAAGSSSNAVAAPNASSGSGSGSAPVKEPRICIACMRRIEGQFVRALNHHYHLDCFRCHDCHQVVADKFFPLKTDAPASTATLTASMANPPPAPSSAPAIFCEKDYFRRLDLLCAQCGGALRGPHINALGKKWHLEHFTCSICTTLFQQNDSYYEREGRVYCQYHYSVLFATRCGGCETAVLKNFVEMKRREGHEGTVAQWHPECYMIYKLWNAAIAASASASRETKDQALRHQQDVTQKVSKILHVLSAFEESSAECISDMLLHFSNQRHAEGVIQASKFICHIEALFRGIDVIESGLAATASNPPDGSAAAGSLTTTTTTSAPLPSTSTTSHKEPRQLAKRIVDFFSLLSVAREAQHRAQATKEMITLVTALAHTLKTLIRGALTGALRLEARAAAAALARTPPRDASGVVVEIKTDLCQACRKSIEEECYAWRSMYRWHPSCLHCRSCQALLRPTATATAAAAVVLDARLFCEEHALVAGATMPFDAQDRLQPVTLLEQYTFLLRCALRRLCVFLNVHLAAPSGGLLGPPSAGHGSAMLNAGSAGLPAPLNRSKSTPLVANIGVVGNTVGVVGGNDLPLMDLTGHDQLAVRQYAVLTLHPMMERFFAFEELMELVETRKPSVWSKMVGAIKPPKKDKIKHEGVFGVPLEVLIERSGVETDLMPVPSLTAPRIPAVLEAILRCLLAQDLAIEGIFRKNGNIRKLRQLCSPEDWPGIPTNNPIQVAAFLKKFLRDLPEPLLTFKLHRLFVCSQKLGDEHTRRQALRLICCLLPKANFDVLVVLIWFFRQVASFA
ncbi:hypothetical protein CXG81DRAFT_11317, partial [Caulochytrium protostelioides]